MIEQVIDASVAVKWVMKGESHRGQARKFLRDSLSSGVRLISPPLFENETESVIQEQVFLRRVSVADADRALQALDRIGIEIIYDPLLKKHARQLARTCNQRRVYDATYAALAQIRGYDFWTADKSFYDATKGMLTFVRYLPDYK
jgi:predicted nucleic acid-binding protein